MNAVLAFRISVEQTGELDMSESEEQQHVSPHDTEARREEHASSQDGDVVSELGNANQERHEEAKVGTQGVWLRAVLFLWVLARIELVVLTTRLAAQHLYAVAWKMMS